MAQERWPEIRFRAMGCQMAAWLDAPPALARPALAAAQSTMDHLELIFSRFLPTSELSQLNARPGEPVRVSSELFEVLEQALAMAEATGGLFDPTLLDALEAAGYDRSFEEVAVFATPGGPTPQIVTAGQQTWRDIRLQRAGHTVTLPPGARLDLGGIAKGWAAQRAARILAEHGPCLVDAGGDLVAIGAPEGLPGWPVALAEPGGSERDLLKLWLRDASVATSGVDRRRWQLGARSMHHLIDPRTGQPATTDVVTATVIAPQAVRAEAWAKASLLLGANGGTAAIAEQSDLAGALLSQDGTLYLTPTMRRWLDAS